MSMAYFDAPWVPIPGVTRPIGLAKLDVHLPRTSNSLGANSETTQSLQRHIRDRRRTGRTCHFPDTISWGNVLWRQVSESEDRHSQCVSQPPGWRHFR